MKENNKTTEKTEVCIFPDQFIYLEKFEVPNARDAMLAMGLRIHHSGMSYGIGESPLRYFVADKTMYDLTSHTHDAFLKEQYGFDRNAPDPTMPVLDDSDIKFFFYKWHIVLHHPDKEVITQRGAYRDQEILSHIDEWNQVQATSYETLIRDRKWGDIMIPYVSTDEGTLLFALHTSGPDSLRRSAVNAYADRFFDSDLNITYLECGTLRLHEVPTAERKKINAFREVEGKICPECLVPLHILPTGNAQHVRNYPMQADVNNIYSLIDKEYANVSDRTFDIMQLKFLAKDGLYPKDLHTHNMFSYDSQFMALDHSINHWTEYVDLAELRKKNAIRVLERDFPDIRKLQVNKSEQSQQHEDERTPETGQSRGITRKR